MIDSIFSMITSGFEHSLFLELCFFLAWSCLGQVPGGVPFSQRSELATACTSRMQITVRIKNRTSEQGEANYELNWKVVFSWNCAAGSKIFQPPADPHALASLLEFQDSEKNQNEFCLSSLHMLTLHMLTWLTLLRKLCTC